MANVKKTEVIDTEAKAVDKEKKALEKKLAEQEKQIAELIAQVKALTEINKVTTEEKPKEKTATKKNIKFVNMTTGGFTIKGSRNYYLAQQFDSKSFSEVEAKVIVNNMPKSIVSGKLYVVADDDFIDECELTDVYTEVLNVNALKGILNKNVNEVCEIYSNACDEQKQIIIDMIYKKKLNGEDVDANILMKLGKISGKDLMGVEPLENE